MSGEEKRLKNLKPPPGGTGIQTPAPPAEPDRAWLSIERKYRVVEYESLTVGLGTTTSLRPGEDFPAAAKRMFRELREEFADIVEVMKEQEGI